MKQKDFHEKWSILINQKLEQIINGFLLIRELLIYNIISYIKVQEFLIKYYDNKNYKYTHVTYGKYFKTIIIKK